MAVSPIFHDASRLKACDYRAINDCVEPIITSDFNARGIIGGMSISCCRCKTAFDALIAASYEMARASHDYGMGVASGEAMLAAQETFWRAVAIARAQQEERS